jgi:hypothetical protein
MLLEELNTSTLQDIQRHNMSKYTPDKWAIVKVVTEDYTVLRIIASWYGGFAGSNSWKLSSGITGMTINGDWYEFTNESGSLYFCNKNCYGMSSYTTSIYGGFQRDFDSIPGSSIEFLNCEDIESEVAKWTT